MCQWKSFDTRSIFDEFMTKTQWLIFGPPCTSSHLLVRICLISGLSFVSWVSWSPDLDFKNGFCGGITARRRPISTFCPFLNYKPMPYVYSINRRTDEMQWVMHDSSAGYRSLVRTVIGPKGHGSEWSLVPNPNPNPNPNSNSNGSRNHNLWPFGLVNCPRSASFLVNSQWENS